MKTQIIQIEPHDDVISVRDKMGWTQTGRLVLVWPARGRLRPAGHVLSRRLDLVLLARHSQSLGCQLALVTRDSRVRDHAQSLGIPVFQSVRAAQERRWKRPVRRLLQSGHLEPRRRLADVIRPERTPAPLKPVPRMAAFSLGVLAVLSIAAVLFPSAEITVSPQMEEQAIHLTIQASESAERVNLSGLLPLRTISTIVEGRSSISTTGTTRLPYQTAKGSVTFTNLTDREITIPEGTVVTVADGSIRFTTDREGRLPAGPGAEISLPVTAALPGSDGNLPAGRVQAIEGELGVFISVTNQRPFSGGEDATSPAATAVDRTALRERLLSSLEGAAREEIRRSLQAGDVLVDAPALANVLEESYDPPGAEPASELALNLRLEYVAHVVTGADLTALAEAILDTRLPAGYKSLPGTLEIEHITQPRFRGPGSASWQMRAVRTIQAVPDRNQAVSLALGKTPSIATQHLAETLPLSADPTIVLYPHWWPLMPLLPFRISFRGG